ncbi:transposase [Pseudomonas fluorescens]|nr:transposase [Pseudomonas fluorescens]
MTSSPNHDQMTPKQLRALAAQALQLQSQIEAMSKKIQNDGSIIEQLTYEIAFLKRHKFAKSSEQISPAQGSLLDDLLDTDLEAIEAELKQLLPTAPPAEPRQSSKRAPLPPQFPRTVIRHEPENTQCAFGCKLQRIGEDVSERLDYTPGEFTIEQHVRGKWACRQCETLIQAPVPAQVIDKGRVGKRAAAIMSLIQSARMNGHDPYAYLKDVLTRLPTQRAIEIDQLLPHRWISTVRHIHHGLTKVDTFQEF